MARRIRRGFEGSCARGRGLDTGHGRASVAMGSRGRRCGRQGLGVIVGRHGGFDGQGSGGARLRRQVDAAREQALQGLAKGRERIAACRVKRALKDGKKKKACSVGVFGN